MLRQKIKTNEKKNKKKKKEKQKRNECKRGINETFQLTEDAWHVRNLDATVLVDSPVYLFSIFLFVNSAWLWILTIGIRTC